MSPKSTERLRDLLLLRESGLAMEAKLPLLSVLRWLSLTGSDAGSRSIRHRNSCAMSCCVSCGEGGYFLF